MSQKGFTFLEVMITLLIISILSGVVGLALYGQVVKARVTAARMQVRTFKTALQNYRADHGVFPTRAQGLAALCGVPTTPPIPSEYPAEGYLDSRRVPDDPWQHPYVYFVPGRDGEPFEVLSYGSDGTPQGAGHAADISSSDL